MGGVFGRLAKTSGDSGKPTLQVDCNRRNCNPSSAALLASATPRHFPGTEAPGTSSSPATVNVAPCDQSSKPCTRMQSPQRSSCSCAHWAWREPPTLKANRKHGATIAFRAHMCHNALALIGPAKSLHASPQSTKTLRCMLRPPLDAPHGFQELGGRQWRCFAANTNNNGNFVFKRTLLPRSLVQGQPKDPEKKMRSLPS